MRLAYTPADPNQFGEGSNNKDLTRPRLADFPIIESTNHAQRLNCSELPRKSGEALNRVVAKPRLRSIF
jgi:hypothetical protein